MDGTAPMNAKNLIFDGILFYLDFRVNL